MYSHDNILILLIGLINLGGLGGIAYWIYWSKFVFVKPTLTEKKLEKYYLKTSADANEMASLIISLGNFKLNLKGKKGKDKSLAMISLDLEVYNKEGFDIVNNQLPKIKNIIIDVISKKRREDLETVRGKLFLKDELLTLINMEIKLGIVKNLFFTSFFIQ